MNAFSIYASGEDFDVDEFLSSSSLVPTRVTRRGEAKSASPQSGHYEKNCVAFELGDGNSIAVSEQEKIAVAFLKANRDELRTLAHLPGVTDFTLWLHCRQEKVRPNLYAFSIGTSSSLMWHVLDTGCALYHWISLEYEDTEDEA